MKKYARELIHDNRTWKEENVEYKLKMIVNGNYDEVNYQNYSFKTMEEARVFASKEIEECLNICRKKDGSPLTLVDFVVSIERKEISRNFWSLEDLLKYKTYYKYFDEHHKRKETIW